MTTNQDQSRAEFEAWASQNTLNLDRDKFGKYDNPYMQAAYESWQAARRAPSVATAVPEGWVLALQTVVEMPDGGKELGYTLLSDVGIFTSAQEVMGGIAELKLPLGWVAMSASQLLPGWMLPVAPSTPVVAEVPDVKEMVNRFLGWKLPQDFYPDAGISFDRAYGEKWGMPIGTNLLTADQAKAMFEYCINYKEK